MVRFHVGSIRGIGANGSIMALQAEGEGSIPSFSNFVRGNSSAVRAADS